MSTSSKNQFFAAAGSVNGADIDDIFSTYLYDGNNGTAQTINNGIDLSTNGGLVWIKQRTQTNNHYLFDTEATEATSALLLPTTNAASPTTTALTSFNTSGFSLGSNANVNGTQDLVSWTFRKSFRFFDVVTYTGTGSTQNINHSLGTAPGFIIVKNYGSNGNDWICYHRSETATHYGRLNTTNFFTNNQNVWDNTEPTSSVFTVGSDADVNTLNETYVAYLFAHNNGDGGFGPDNDKDVIKCGSYVGNATTNNINLGFEPQWVLFKRVDSGDSWYFLDSMRGFVDLSTGDKGLTHDTGQEIDIAATFGSQGPSLTPTGFELKSAAINASGGGEYIYVAIRRGALREPENATNVFNIDTLGSGPPGFQSGFPVDMAIRKYVAGAADINIAARQLDGNILKTDTTAAMTSSAEYVFDYQNGWNSSSSTDSSTYSWMWKRAPSYFDVVNYIGPNTSSTVNHNLGVVPGMFWVKNRDADEGLHWNVWHTDLNGDEFLELNENSQASTNSGTSRRFGTVTSTTVQLIPNSTGTGVGNVSRNNENFVMYLFGTVSGVSKVGSYTGDGTTDGSKVIDCGFSNGAKFVLIKRTDAQGNWVLIDSVRGISSGSDPYIYLNSSATHTPFNFIGPNNSGFALTSNSGNTNALDGSYIFYAIAT